MRRGVASALAAFAALPLAPAHADNWDQAKIEHHPRSIAYYQLHDQRLQDVGWRLVRGNAEFCERTIPSIGLQLQDATTFGAPDIARQALSLTGDFAVATSAQGSPSEVSGALSRNREVTHLGNTDLNALAIKRGAKWERLSRAHDLLDQLLSRGEPISITLTTGDSANIAPVSVCAGRFELAADSKTLVATDERVLVGMKSRVFTYPEDMFASGISHELAHTVLRHTEWLDRNGRNPSITRKTEREADRLMPWLLANAGYDPAAAARFFRDYRPNSGGVLFIRGSHPRWRERVAAVEAEVEVIRELMAVEGKADWRTHFRREIDPDQGRERAEN